MSDVRCQMSACESPAGYWTLMRRANVHIWHLTSDI